MTSSHYFLINALFSVIHSAAVPAQQEEITPATLGGLDFCSSWLKTRLVEIKTELGQIHEQLREFEGG